MGRKTIYIKPEKEALYEQAVQMSGNDSLSAILEKAVENLVRERDSSYYNILLTAVLSRTSVPLIFQRLITELKKHFQSSLPELWNKANHTLDVMRFKGFFNEEAGVFRGIESVGSEQTLDDQLWYRGILEDMKWLDDLYLLSISPEFAEYEQEYRDYIESEVKKIISPEDFERLIQRINMKAK